MEKIPKFAKKVFEGILFDVFQWEQKLFDGTTTTFEAIKRIPSTQLIVVKNRKIILYHEEQPNKGKYISMPGGMVDRGEEIIKAAKRELLEELGMQVENEREFIFYFKEDFSNKKISWETHYFIVKNPMKITTPKLDGGEKIEPFEVNFEEFIEITKRDDFLNKNFTNFLNKLESNNKLTEFKNLLLK